MKTIKIVLLVLFTTTIMADEIDLTTVPNSAYGECVDRAFHIRSGNEITEDQFEPYMTFQLERAKERAIDFYRAYTNGYTLCGGELDEPQNCELNVVAKLIQYNDTWGDKEFGVKVEVDMGADEDHVTFYFYQSPTYKKVYSSEGEYKNWSKDPEMGETQFDYVRDFFSDFLKLQLAYHDEQSPTAYWVCE